MIVIGFVVLLLAVHRGTGGAGVAGTAPTYPKVPGTIGRHLDQLEKAIG